MSRPTLTEKAYKQLKEMIVSSQLLPGTPLQEVELSNLLDISRTPIREVLRTLNSEGLVEILPHRGARVALISFEDIMNAYEARGWVEPEIVAKAALNIDDATISMLVEAASKMPSNPSSYEESIIAKTADHEFHDILITTAGNRFGKTLILTTRSITKRVASFVPPGRYAQSKLEHMAIIEALRNRDPEEARRLSKDHILEAANRIYKYLRNNFPFPAWKLKIKEIEV